MVINLRVSKATLVLLCACLVSSCLHGGGPSHIHSWTPTIRAGETLAAAIERERNERKAERAALVFPERPSGGIITPIPWSDGFSEALPAKIIAKLDAFEVERAKFDVIMRDFTVLNAKDSTFKLQVGGVLLIQCKSCSRVTLDGIIVIVNRINAAYASDPTLLKRVQPHGRSVAILSLKSFLEGLVSGITVPLSPIAPENLPLGLVPEHLTRALAPLVKDFDQLYGRLTGTGDLFNMFFDKVYSANSASKQNFYDVLRDSELDEDSQLIALRASFEQFKEDAIIAALFSNVFESKKVALVEKRAAIEHEVARLKGASLGIVSGKKVALQHSVSGQAGRFLVADDAGYLKLAPEGTNRFNPVVQFELGLEGERVWFRSGNDVVTTPSVWGGPESAVESVRVQLVEGGLQ